MSGIIEAQEYSKYKNSMSCVWMVVDVNVCLHHAFKQEGEQEKATKRVRAP